MAGANLSVVIEGLENDFPPLDTIEGAGPATETVTVLVADMMDLSRRVRALSPDQFRAFIAEYHRTLRHVLTETGGMGVVSFADTAVAVYRLARHAAFAAAKLQLTASKDAWPSDARIRIAVALDSGEVVATGYGHFGPAVNRCHRIVEQASGGGEVLVSEATKNLLEGEDLGNLEPRESKHIFPLTPSEPRILRPGRRWRTLMPIYELIVPGLPPDYQGSANGNASSSHPRRK